jgi:outer membrane receptor protein involved in Fe transport
VATFVDGISRSRSGLVAASDFLDVERVEVLKGPQGTLFGKNTTAGLMHLISKAPGFKGLDGQVSLGYESYGTWRAKLSSNIPVSKELAFRVAGNVAKGDGWMTVVPSGQKIHGLDRSAVKLQMLWRPSAAFKAHVIADYAQLDEICCAPMRLINDPAAVATNLPFAAAAGSTIVNPPDLKALKVESNLPPEYKARDQGVSAELAWNLPNGLSVTSLTGWRSYKDSNIKDNDFSGVDILRSNDDLPKVDLMSQELRLAGSSADKTIDWMLGAYLSKETIQRQSDFIWGSQVLGLFPFPIPSPGVGFEHSFKQDIDSQALFGHGTLNLSKQWAVTGGLRWSRDEKHGVLKSNYPVLNAFGAPNSLPLAVVHDYDTQLKQSAPTYTLSLQYKPANNTMVYGTVSRGYKSGGISMTRDAAGQALFFGAPDGSCPPGSVAAGPGTCSAPPQSPTFDKETADHVELGMKTELMNRKVQINSALWHTKFKGLQLQTLRSDGSFAVTNAEGAVSQGLEIDITARVVQGLALTASAQYADATFADGIPALSPGFPALGGQRLPFSSRWTMGLGFNFVRPIGDNWRYFANGAANYRSSYFNFTEPRADLVQKAYTTLNLRTGVGSEKWEVAAFCRNCTDERVTNSNFALPFDGRQFFASTRFTHVSEPRVIGATLTYFFD